MVIVYDPATGTAEVDNSRNPRGRLREATINLPPGLGPGMDLYQKIYEFNYF